MATRSLVPSLGARSGIGIDLGSRRHESTPGINCARFKNASEQVKQRRMEARGWRWLPFSLGLGKTIFSSEPLDSN